MNKILLSAFLILGFQAGAQPIYMSTSSKVSFFAGTPVEDIDAVNSKSLSFLNITTGEVTISIPNKEFHFKRSLMEEHFNENYIESEKYPKSEFKGKINDVQKIDLASKDPMAITITGVLTVHGVQKERTLNVTLRIHDGKIEGETKFDIPLADHNIERPKILWEKMAENVSVTSLFTYEPYNKK